MIWKMIFLNIKKIGKKTHLGLVDMITTFRAFATSVTRAKKDGCITVILCVKQRTVFSTLTAGLQTSRCKKVHFECVEIEYFGSSINFFNTVCSHSVT